MTAASTQDTIVGRGAREGARLFREWFEALRQPRGGRGEAAYVFVMGSLAELLRTFDMPVVFPEINSLQTAVRGIAHEYLNEAEHYGYSPDICGYVKADVALQLRGGEHPMGRIPKPGISVLTNACNTYLKWAEIWERMYHIPVFTVDIPGLISFSGTNSTRLNPWISTFSGKVMDQVYNQPIGQTSRRRGIDCRHHRSIQPIAVDCHQTSGPSRNQLQYSCGTAFVHIFGSENLRPIGLGRGNFLLASAADTAHAHLYQSMNPRHLGDSAHRAASTLSNAVYFMAPIKMCINLDYRERSRFLISAKDRDWDRVMHRQARSVSLRYLSQTVPNALGVDPVSGAPVFLLTGQYGPYVQLGEVSDDHPRPKRMSLPRGVTPEQVTLDRALELLALPRLLGTHPETGGKVSAGLGRFGPSIVHDHGKEGKDYRSLKGEDDVLTVGLPRALELLAQAKLGRGRRAEPKPLRDLGPHPEDQAPVLLFEGKYGP